MSRVLLSNQQEILLKSLQRVRWLLEIGYNYISENLPGIINKLHIQSQWHFLWLSVLFDDVVTTMIVHIVPAALLDGRNA